MFFKKQYEARVGNNEMIMSELLSNAFRSVQHQIRVAPLSNCLNSSTKRARCRLNLYAMNIGILNYVLVAKLRANAKLYVAKLRNNLLETICHVDPQVVENIEELILDKELISDLIDRKIYDEDYRVFTKKELLNSFLLIRLKEYHFAIELKTKLLSKSDSNTVKPYLTNYPITKVFTQDFLGIDNKVSADFSITFAHNISMKSLNLFSAEIDEIFS